LFKILLIIVQIVSKIGIERIITGIIGGTMEFLDCVRNTENEAAKNPRLKAPTSPINVLAFGKLKIKKPRSEKTIHNEKIINSKLFEM
jgi:hypothetical protein